MRVIDAAGIRKALSFATLIPFMEAAHRRPVIEIGDGLLGSDEAQYYTRHAVDRGRFMVSKLVTSFPSNPGTTGLPAVQAVVVLFDGADGRPLAVMDGTELTYWRTAADSGLGAKLLAPREPRTLLVIGAGALAPWLVRAHLAVRPSLARILIWNRTPAGAEALAASLAQEGIAAEPTPDLDAATLLADVITACTRSDRALVKGASLKQGAHLDLVGGYMPQMREADDEAFRRSRIFVDRREPALLTGDISQPLASGVIGEGDVLGDLRDLVGGIVAGRGSEAEITCFKNAGGAHLDLMTAELVFRQIMREA
jgi:ornithine cyclodeaminase